MKPEKYAHAGVAWYLRVELECPHHSPPEVTVYRLVEGGYIKDACVHAGQLLRLTEPIDLSFDPAVLAQDRL